MAVTEILCRFDPAKQQPVVFLRDTINAGKIQVWTEGQKAAYVPLDYYSMTRHLSADDERVLMERFKQATNRADQVVHINHRLPRSPRATPNMLARSAPSVLVSETAAARKASGNAKSLESQPAPAGPTGDLPQPGETLAPVQAVAAPRLTERASAAIWRQIEEENAKLSSLTPMIADFKHKLEVATAECQAAQHRVQALSAEYSTAIQKEAQEDLQQNMARLSNLTDPIANLAQVLQDAGAQPATPPAQEAAAPAAPAPAAPAPAATNGGKATRGQGGKFVAKSAPGKAKK